MKDNTLILLVAECGLIALAVAGLVCGVDDLARYASGAFVGVLAGHINGQQKAT